MNDDVPYLPAIKNLSSILDAIQKAGIPEAFGYDFLRDLGFTSSNDRAVVKVLKYLGFLDASGRPQQAYRDFVDHTRAKVVLAQRLQTAYDDLYTSDRQAHNKTVDQLTGWFKAKTGTSDSVAKKIATTFKSLAGYADFASSPPKQDEGTATPPKNSDDKARDDESESSRRFSEALGLVYRIEIHLPDTQNIDTYRSIFRALREELGV